MLSKLKPYRRVLLLCSVIFMVAFTIYYITGEGHANYYNYYVRLADAFLHGRLYLTDNPSWLNELVPNPSGPGYYVVYPPLPAVIMTPLVAVFGLGLNQTSVSLFFGSATVVVAFFVSKDVLRKPEETSHKYEIDISGLQRCLGLGQFSGG
jgi:hypothetical protein